MLNFLSKGTEDLGTHLLAFLQSATNHVIESEPLRFGSSEKTIRRQPFDSDQEFHQGHVRRQRRSLCCRRWFQFTPGRRTPSQQLQRRLLKINQVSVPWPRLAFLVDYRLFA